MIEEPFAAGQSIIHHIDPRFRVVAAVVYSFAAAVSHQFATLFVALFFSLILFFCARINVWRAAKRLLMVNGFLFFFWLMLPVFVKDPPFVDLGFVSLSIPGILLAAKITIKSNAILLALISLVATIPFISLGHSLNLLKLPDKLVFLLLLTYRYIFVIEQEYEKIIRAIKIRGFAPSTSLHTYKTIAYIIGMLFVRASERSERVYNAMRCRGFNRKFYSLADFKASASSWLFLLLVSMTSVGMIFLDVIHHA